MAFTDYETERIREALLAEARHCAVTLGVRKTSVDQLTQAVGISKGSFYKFYDSKELLFFAVLEDIHTELYAIADQSLDENQCLSPAERATAAILTVCKRMSDTGVLTFIENDAENLLRRLPESVKTAHYHDDEAHISELLEKYRLTPKGGAKLTTAMVRGLILTVSHKAQIGDFYPQVLSALTHGACKELFD